MTANDLSDLWPLAAYFGLVVLVVGGMLGISYFLGERHEERATSDPYESGMPATGTARLRLSANYYLVAMFFVMFDLEAAYLFAWAIGAVELGWAGYAEVCVFIFVLLAALVYIWRLGALDWGPQTRRSARRKEA